MTEDFVEVGLTYSYRLLHPKLVAIIVACDQQGKPNPMAAAWVMPVSVNPPLIVVAISPKRYTFELIERTQEFTVNIPSTDLIKETHYVGTVSGRSVDKVSRLGLKTIPAKRIKTPILADCIAALECEVYNIVEAGDHYLILGKVLTAYVKKGVFDRTYNLRRFRPLLHLGGDNYTTTIEEVLKPEK